MRKFILAGLLAAVAFSASAQNPATSPVGKWKTLDDKTGKAMTITEVYEAKNGTLAAKIVENLHDPFRAGGRDPRPEGRPESRHQRPALCQRPGCANKPATMPRASPARSGLFCAHPLHLGHLVGYIQADIWVRARRMRGDTVHFVCADDTHGTPIMLAAEKAGVTPEAFIAGIQASHERDFAAFGVAFDHYDSTNSPPTAN
jgi:hypothetical protein